MKLILFAACTMAFFAANSILCRLALAESGMDAASYTIIRAGSGALLLWLIVALRGQRAHRAGSWRAALALFGYMAFFSFAYVRLAAAPGVLILVVAIQVTMLALGFQLGEKTNAKQLAGLGLAFCGVCILLLPGLSSPPPGSALLMAVSGISWGFYCVFGREVHDPTLHTAGNFIRCLLFCPLLLPFCQMPPMMGVVYALLAGAIASGIGYSIWYLVVAQLSITSAAVAQLGSPVFTAIGAVLFLGEPLTPRLCLCLAMVLAGIYYAESRGKRRS